MRILLLSIGLGAYAAQLARALTERGNVVRLVLVEEQLAELRSDLPLFFGNPPFSIAALSTRSPARRFKGCAGELLRVAMRRYDVVHIVIPGPVVETALIARTARWFKIPVVLTLHDAQFHPGDLHSFRFFRLFLRIMDCASSFIVHGEQIAAIAESNLLVERSRMSIISHGNFDILLETPVLPVRHDRIRVLFFGRMRKYKGLDVLLQAAPLLREAAPQALIVIAGSGPELDRLRGECDRHDNIEVREGYVRTKDIGPLFAECHAVVLPYIEASQSGPLAIAYTFGKPVVASAVGAIPEILTSEIEGLLVKPGDPRELARALGRVACDRALAARLGAAAGRKAQSALGWSGIAEKTITAYADAPRCGNLSRKMRAVGEGWEQLRRYYEGCLREHD